MVGISYIELLVIGVIGGVVVLAVVAGAVLLVVATQNKSGEKKQDR